MGLFDKRKAAREAVDREAILARIAAAATDEELATLDRLFKNPTIREMAMNKAKKHLG